MLRKAAFCVWDGDPALSTPSEAWVALGNRSEWEAADAFKVFAEAGVLSRAAFNARFPSLPPLPSKFEKALSTGGATVE